ncbi:Phenylalanine ammonia-lyase [Mycena sanguinolenta]|uniref:Phenylalanine ammonia-lyase n=1 Tax=Mycena sanguinolenta TaxID=230812 RepID=A0A8H6Y2M4_9AGAR|nr:Phenylalanine ammonia-lyase [Mycena sanguinolenta]
MATTGKLFNDVETKAMPTDLLGEFVNQYLELESYKNGRVIEIDGYSLSIPAVTAAARYGAPVVLKDSPVIKERLDKSRAVIVDKIEGNKSVYGVSTGFGGSADTRTSNTLALGKALLQHQHSGVLPSDTNPISGPLPLLDPLASTSMPEAWVRGAILVRINSLIRGHSGVRLELIQKMAELLRANVTPLVPLRASISASGDLIPLSYVAGTLMGNPSIRVFDGPQGFGSRQVVSSVKALENHNITPITLLSKEHLGILNGTAFSASVCTAMGTEVMLGERMNNAPFIHAVARPHPGQVEVAQRIWDLLDGSKLAHGHEEDVTIEEDKGELRQDRYPLRTAPQFLGPQIEDLLASLKTITLECNSIRCQQLTTRLWTGENGEVHHGGNFQAMAVSNAMEKTRLSLHHIGKLLFAQQAEIIDPSMNRGLPPSLAATDPSINYHGKGVDIASAAYVAELGYLANPVSTHIQSAEMHNQAVNSLALISARATINSLEVLSMLISGYLYLLCQAYDLRALQADFRRGLAEIVQEELSSHFGAHFSNVDDLPLLNKVLTTMYNVVDHTTTMDASARMVKVAESTTSILVEFFMATSDTSLSVAALSALPNYREAVATRAAAKLVALREEYLLGARGPAPASAWLEKTLPIYEFIRVTLGIRMHGAENLTAFSEGLGVQDVTVGQNVSLIHEAIRDGKMQAVVVGLFN